MTLIIINVSSGLAAILMVIAAFQLYVLTRSSGIMVMFLSALYLTAVRLIIGATEIFAPCSHILLYRSHLIAPFWPAMAIGFFLLLRSLKRLYKSDSSGDRMRDRQFDIEETGRENAQ